MNCNTIDVGLGAGRKTSRSVNSAGAVTGRISKMLMTCGAEYDSGIRYQILQLKNESEWRGILAQVLSLALYNADEGVHRDR